MQRICSESISHLKISGDTSPLGARSMDMDTPEYLESPFDLKAEKMRIAKKESMRFKMNSS